MPQTLLLADDSVTIQRVIELTFADEDIKVVAVSDGDQAIARIEASPPDIVLADIGMPGRTGYEVARYIKASPRLAHIPVVLLTGAFEPVDQAKAAEAGCDGVLAKPFEPQLVIQRVKELLARPRAVSLDPVPAPPANPEPEPPAPEPEPPAPEPAEHAAVAAKPSTSATDVDNYFDRLDEAFANLSASSTGGPAVPRTVPDRALQLDQLAPMHPVRDDDVIDIDWFGQKPGIDPVQTSALDFPITIEPPPVEAAHVEPEPEPMPEPEPEPVVAQPAAFEPQAPVPVVVGPQLVAPTPEPVAPSLPASVSMPALADAFAALLAAEQRVGAPAWPTGPSLDAAGRAPVAAVDLDKLAIDVTERVLDQLSARADQVVRETVADLVSQIAERLVRDEIERIKNSIK